MEFFFPLFRLLEMGWQVDVAAPNKKEISGEHGYTFNPTITIDEVNPDNYDLLIIPGGFPDGAPATVRKIKKAQDITKSFFERNKLVASICHGPWTLASADVINGRHLTSYWHDGVPEDSKVQPCYSRSILDVNNMYYCTSHRNLQHLPCVLLIPYSPSGTGKLWVL